MTANGKTFTPTQTRMLEVLSDGEPHSRQELHACLYDNDPQASLSNINNHITAIRAKIKPLGESILCVLVARQPHYRHVKLL